MKRTILIDDKEVTFVSSALTPMLYNDYYTGSFSKTCVKHRVTKERLPSSSADSHTSWRNRQTQVSERWKSGLTSSECSLFTPHCHSLQICGRWHLHRIQQRKKKQTNGKGAECGSLSVALLSEQHSTR